MQPSPSIRPDKSADLERSTQSPRKRSFNWRKAAANIATLIAVGALAVTAARLLGATWLKILTYSIVIALLMGLGILGAIYDKLGTWIDKGFMIALRAYLLFFGWMLIAFLPAVVILKLNRRIVTFPRTFQVLIFIGWGVLLAVMVWVVATERRRLQFFGWLETKIGRFTPLAYSFNLLMIAMIFFASITYVSAHDRFLPVKSNQTAVTVDSLHDFYLWHFVDAVPLLRVTDTIGWQKPMNYEGHLVGWILLLFKLAVIIPVIASFTSYWRNFGASHNTLATAHQSAHTGRHAGRRIRRAGGSTYYRRIARGYARSNR
jgi:hypothetical protein